MPSGHLPTATAPTQAWYVRYPLLTRVPQYLPVYPVTYPCSPVVSWSRQRPGGRLRRRYRRRRPPPSPPVTQFVRDPRLEPSPYRGLPETVPVNSLQTKRHKQGAGGGARGCAGTPNTTGAKLYWRSNDIKKDNTEECFYNSFHASKRADVNTKQCTKSEKLRAEAASRYVNEASSNTVFHTRATRQILIHANNVLTT